MLQFADALILLKRPEDKMTQIREHTVLCSVILYDYSIFIRLGGSACLHSTGEILGKGQSGDEAQAKNRPVS